MTIAILKSLKTKKPPVSEHYPDNRSIRIAIKIEQKYNFESNSKFELNINSIRIQKSSPE